MAVEDINGKMNKSVILYTAGDKEYMATNSKYQYRVLQDDCKVSPQSILASVPRYRGYMLLYSLDYETCDMIATYYLNYNLFEFAFIGWLRIEF